jgi:ParB family chromosome partitioning protein
MAKKPARLGRGLNALVGNRRPFQPAPPANDEASAASPVDTTPYREIPVADIRPNPRQPRTTFSDRSLDELALSIKAQGVLQPIVVRKVDDAYELVAGERRWRASQAAGLETIPAIIRDLSDSQSLELALIENLQREDLGPLERAAAYQNYLEAFGGSIEDLARRLSESRANISNYLRLLKLHPKVCYMLGRGELGMGQARAVGGLEDHTKQLAIAGLAVRRNLSVRQVEDLVRQALEGNDQDDSNNSVSRETSLSHFTEVERSLSKAVGLKVKLRPGRRKNAGRIVIAYNNLDEFDLIAEKLGGNISLY